MIPIVCSEKLALPVMAGLRIGAFREVDCALCDKGVSPRDDIYSNTRSTPPGVYKSEEKFITWVGKGGP